MPNDTSPPGTAKVSRASPKFGVRMPPETRALLNRKANAAGLSESALIRALMLEDGTRSIICSIPAHGKGKNLQQFHVAHWLEVPGSNHVCEQLLGRHHRYGQLANAVDVHMWAGTWLAHRALQRATEKDRLVAETTKERRKLLYATRVGVFEDAEPLIDVDALFDDERA